MRATGYKVLVKPIETERKTKGGIIIPESEAQKYDLQGVKGEVMDVGPLAFMEERRTYKEFGISCMTPSVGDRVIIGKYSGALVEEEGERYRLINDDDILAVIEGEDEHGSSEYNDPFV